MKFAQGVQMIFKGGHITIIQLEGKHVIWANFGYK